MKRIEKFVASDGSEYLTEQEAIHRERLLDELNFIESLLPEHPHTTEFSNGGGYIQHDPKRVTQAKMMLYKLACTKMSVLTNYKLETYAFSRYLSDNTSMGVFYSLYSRLVYCMNTDLWREYGQGYYATHPDEADQVCINEE